MPRVKKTTEDMKVFAGQKEYDEPETFVTRGTTMSNEERQYSSEKDHKGSSHPLCLNCGHREDMHHAWKYFQVPVTMKDRNGISFTEYRDAKEPRFDTEKPCQHACKCTEYK